ncbi:MAG: hypothetical protein RBU23_09395 [Candidatus Auribacterota bacterium]|jgi:capsid protein|nr:hypothetical protein [Candidatus Auribacterota bacterium]
MSEHKTISQIFSDGIDGMIGVFSPRSAFRRKMFREAIRVSQSFRAYKGAQHDRIRSSWIPGGGSADETLLPELADIRERSRDLNRNDAVLFM